MEEWKPIPKYENTYEISTLGRVRSLDRIIPYIDGRDRPVKGKIRPLYIDNLGYYNVNLSLNGKNTRERVHVLVAITFLDHTPGKLTKVVDHIDNDKNNNTLSNIEVLSHRQNCFKDRRQSSSKYHGVSWDKNAKKWRARVQVNYTPTHLGLFDTEDEAGKIVAEYIKKIEC